MLYAYSEMIALNKLYTHFLKYVLFIPPFCHFISFGQHLSIPSTLQPLVLIILILYKHMVFIFPNEDVVLSSLHWSSPKRPEEKALLLYRNSFPLSMPSDDQDRKFFTRDLWKLEAPVPWLCYKRSLSDTMVSNQTLQNPVNSKAQNHFQSMVKRSNNQHHTISHVGSLLRGERDHREVLGVPLWLQ